MSLNSTVFQTGTALGAAVDGSMLLSYSYETVVVVLEVFMFLPTIIYQFLIKDPESQRADPSTQAS